jgi:hypothetical protein
LSHITKLINKELEKLNPQNLSQNELIYLLFLYLGSLDKKINRQTMQEMPNPTILIYAIQLQEHDDIKIRKEALKQIENFEKLESQTGL